MNANNLIRFDKRLDNFWKTGHHPWLQIRTKMQSYWWSLIVFRMDVILASSRGEGTRGALETITSITSQTHYHLLIRGQNAQTHQPSHRYTSTHTHQSHTTTTSTSSGVLWHRWKNQPSITPLTQHPQQTSPLWRIFFQRKHTSSYIKSHQP